MNITIGETLQHKNGEYYYIINVKQTINGTIIYYHAENKEREIWSCPQVDFEHNGSLHYAETPIVSDSAKCKIALGLYRHYKGGKYRVIGIALDSETQCEVVVYKALYGSCDLWVRDAAMFNETIVNNGAIIKRFEQIND